jgi:hypothetical protein
MYSTRYINKPIRSFLSRSYVESQDSNLLIGEVVSLKKLYMGDPS